MEAGAAGSKGLADDPVCAGEISAGKEFFHVICQVNPRRRHRDAWERMEFVSMRLLA